MKIQLTRRLRDYLASGKYWISDYRREKFPIWEVELISSDERLPLPTDEGSHAAFFEEFDQAFDATGRSVTVYCDKPSWYPRAIKSAAKRRKLDPCFVSPKEMLRRHHISKFDVIWLSESVFVSSVKLYRSWTSIEAFQYRIGLISRNREKEMSLYVYSISSFKKSKVEATSVAVQPSKLPMNFVKELVKRPTTGPL
jgi:hypothetical protein